MGAPAAATFTAAEVAFVEPTSFDARTLTVSVLPASPLVTV